MPSSIAHASVAVLLRPVFGDRVATDRILATAGIVAALIDVDAIGRPFHLGDIAWLGGHRAVTHSVFLAIAFGVVAVLWRARHDSRKIAVATGVYFGPVLLSHGVLDAFTTYGEGVAFFAPLSMTRWKSSWQPFSGILPEMLLLWMPAYVVHRFHRKRRSAVRSR